ncbi:MAG: DUF4974 domain-containing protein [Chitinophagaceae bacterium]|nr:DUF4974 domain-containing protein [Chitinophagaceae bacterium]
MTENQNRLEPLLDKFSQNEVNESEFNELCELIAASENDTILKVKLVNDIQQAKHYPIDKRKMDKMLLKVLYPEGAPVYQMQKRKIFSWTKIAAAAIIILMVSAGVYWYTAIQTKSDKLIAKEESSIQNDVAPGKEGAILTLANGKQIVLDSAGNGKISDAAVKNGNEISYLNGEKSIIENNTMSTPNGRQFQLILADGSKVGLNAASSITFPTAFTGKERKVSVTGEVYFAVAHNDKIPFIVEHNNISVQVLGTHFNVNTYADETLSRITLLQGSVKVALLQAKGYKTIILKPNQQAQVTSEIKIVNVVDVDEVMAWKNGLFNFKNADIKEIMRQAARWYDVDVIYEGNISNEKFIGKVARNTNLSEMMKILELNGVKYRIEGKKVIVM